MLRSVWMCAIGTIVMYLVLAVGCSQTVDLDRVSPPAASAVKTAFPAARVAKTTVESGGALKLYEVELTEGQRTITVTVSAEGTIVEVETTVTPGEVPKPVEDALTKATRDGTLIKLEKVEHRATVLGGRITMLDKPEIFYEAKYRKWGIMHEVQWAPDGTAR
jgi:hypothetical protein